MLACSVSSIHLQWIVQGQWPSNLEGKNIPAIVQIQKVLKVSAAAMTIEAKLVGLADSEHHLDDVELSAFLEQNIRLSWRAPPRKPLVGERWRLQVRLRRPRGFANPGGFDYHAWLLNSAYVATGYVRKDPGNARLSEAKLDTLDYLRQGLDRRLFRHADLPYLGILRALLLGDSSAVSDQHWRVLNRTGTVHLMAISGLHIGLIAWAAFILTRRMLFFCQSFTVLQVLPSLVSVLSSGLYAALSSWSLPTQRAWLMVLIVNVFLCWGRKIHPLKGLLFIAVVSLLNNPLASTQSGFYLSFAAVFFLIFCFFGQSGKEGAVRGMFSAQWVVFWGVGVVLVILKLPVSMVGPLANIIAIPVISFIVIPLLFISALLLPLAESLSFICLYASHQALAALWWLLDCLSSFNGLFHASAGVLAGMLAIVGVLFLLSPKALFLRPLGALMLVLFVASALSPQQEEGTVELSILDVGQGLALVLESTEQVLVYDVGAKYASGFDTGARIVVPFLRYRGHETVDQLVISHGDNDHMGGLDGVLEEIEVRQLVLNPSEPIAFPADTAVTGCLRGQRWQQGGVNIEVLWPTKEGLDLKTNNRSCVMLIEIFDFRVLLTGDIERTVEEQLLEEDVLPKAIDVLVAPHHGSRTSSSHAFIRHLAPKHVVFSAGYKNAYRHPSPVVLARYRQMNSQLWNTGEQGAVTVRFKKSEKMSISVERLGNPKPWY